MEIVASSEFFKTVEGKFQFHCVRGIIRQNGQLYCARWNNRRQVPHDFSQMQDVERVETERRGPYYRPVWARTSGDDYYIKTPDLFAYAYCSGLQLETRIFREVENCELLKEHPHLNIATYHGCIVKHERVSGLCFEKYSTTLMEKVNPGSKNKIDFLSGGRPLVDGNIRASLSGILRGILHLHSIGLVHNDLTPSNIMFTQDGTAVITDFDSCRRIGESLRETGSKRTHGWHDPSVEFAQTQNDLDAFGEIMHWLLGSAVEEYQFK